MNIIKNLKTEISTLKKENNDMINIVAKVPLKELLDMKEKNTKLQNKVNDLKVQLAARDEEVVEAVVSETLETPQLIKKNIVKSNFECDFWEFKAKSRHGLKTHFGHMHKDHKKNAGVALLSSESDNKTLTVASKLPSFQVFMCKLCGEEFLIHDESTKHAYAHVIFQTVDMTPLPY